MSTIILLFQHELDAQWNIGFGKVQMNNVPRFERAEGSLGGVVLPEGCVWSAQRLGRQEPFVG